MLEINSEKIKKELSKQKIGNIIAIGICVIIAVVLAGFTYLAYTKEEPEVSEMKDIMSNRLNVNKYAQILNTDEPYIFAEDDEGKYYILVSETNGDTYLCIAYMKEKKYKELEWNTPENPTLVKGITKAIPSDLKQLLIDEDEFFDKDNFETYLGRIYIDATQNPNDITAFLVWFVVIAIFLITFGMNFRTQNKITKRTFQNLSEVELDEACAEMEKEETSKWEKQKFYVGEKYIVFFKSGLDIIKYTDMIWVYEMVHSYNGVPTARSLIVWTEDKVKHPLLNFKYSRKKAEGEFEQLFSYVASKKSNVLVGFDKETRQKALEEYGVK